jgi:RNA polymerase sigma-70 factor (ECF subfamily)
MDMIALTAGTVHAALSEADLGALLAPIHDQARATAHRLSGSSTEGDDLFHEAVLRAMDKLKGLREPERFPGWFYMVMISVHRNRSRRGFWRRWFRLEDAVEPVGQDGQTWEDERHRAARVSRALAGLPAEQREAIVLFELDGFSIEEVAALQAGSVAAVKSRLSRGRAALRRHYERLGIAASRPSGDEDQKGQANART